MKNKFVKYIGVLAFIGLFAFASCVKLDVAPTDRFTEKNYWTSTEKAMMVLNMAYKQMYNAGQIFSNEMMTDNLYTDRADNTIVTIANGTANAANGKFSSEWKDCYEGIKTCHIFLQYVDLVPDMNSTLKARMKAEIRFIRAFLFARLSSSFGAVPLFFKDITLEESKTIARTPKAEVLAHVHSELDAILNDLPINKEYVGKDVGRISRGAVIAYKARLYLWENDWDGVITNCEKLIGKTADGEYSLCQSSYEEMFTFAFQNNSEVILDRQYVPLLITWGEMFDLIPISVGGRVNSATPTKSLVDSYIMSNGKAINDPASGYDKENPYVNRDPRFDATIIHNGSKWVGKDGTTTIDTKGGQDDGFKSGSGSKGGYYIRKFFDVTASTNQTSGMNVMLIRYADILMMYAEAKFEKGLMTKDIWDLTIKPIRVRAGFISNSALEFPLLGETAMREVIRNERRVEFAIEGLRLYDIRRWKTAETVLNATFYGAKFGEEINDGYILLGKRSFNKQRDYLWAVPTSQRDLNKNLGQNPGY